MCSDVAFLEAAAAIGRRIARDAVWHDGTCSWMGAVADADRPWRVESRALGPVLYDGTAGVGLFLAELAAATGEPAHRRVALGALRHAGRRAHALAPERRDGFHAGTLGVAWALSHTAALLEAEELLDAARGLVVAAPPHARPGGCADVILGRAGALLALLALAEPLDRPELVDQAVATGDELMAGAVRTPHGWCWPVPGPRRARPLCGLAHGAAGIGWALLELFAATGDERFRAAAAGAFAWERSWLDPRSGTWPDLRLSGQRRGARPIVASPAAGTWCHGEAGIALTRLRAVAVLGTDDACEDAARALAATRHRVDEAVRHDVDDLTLCHGAAGAADVLMSGGDAAGAARTLGCLALDRYQEGETGWPGGAGRCTSPELFRGLSGIGWWLLRLHRAATPSPLTMPVRELTRGCGPA